MNKTFENIINEGKKNGKKLSEINLPSGLHHDPRRPPDRLV